MYTKDFRIKYNMTQAEFAATYDINLRTLQGWERNGTTPAYVWKFLDHEDLLRDIQRELARKSVQIEERQLALHDRHRDEVLKGEVGYWTGCNAELHEVGDWFLHFADWARG